MNNMYFNYLKKRFFILIIFTFALFLGSYGVMFAEESSVEVVPAAEQTNTSSETQTTTGTSVVDSTEQSSIDQTQTTTGGVK